MNRIGAEERENHSEVETPTCAQLIPKKPADVLMNARRLQITSEASSFKTLLTCKRQTKRKEEEEEEKNGRKSQTARDKEKHVQLLQISGGKSSGGVRALTDADQYSTLEPLSSLTLLCAVPSATSRTRRSIAEGFSSFCLPLFRKKRKKWGEKG